MSWTAVNPKIIGSLGVNLAKKCQVRVAASQTYKKGTPFVMTSGQATIATDDAVPWGQFATDVATAVAANTLVDAWKWEVGTKLEIYVCTNGTASAIDYTAIGNAYDLEMIGTAPTEVAYLDLGASSDKLFKVLEIASDYNSLRNAAADSPGLAIVEVMKVQT